MGSLSSTINMARGRDIAGRPKSARRPTSRTVIASACRILAPVPTRTPLATIRYSAQVGVPSKSCRSNGSSARNGPPSRAARTRRHPHSGGRCPEFQHPTSASCSTASRAPVLVRSAQLVAARTIRWTSSGASISRRPPWSCEAGRDRADAQKFAVGFRRGRQSLDVGSIADAQVGLEPAASRLSSKTAQLKPKNHNGRAPGTPMGHSSASDPSHPFRPRPHRWPTGSRAEEPGVGRGRDRVIREDEFPKRRIEVRAGRGVTVRSRKFGGAG